MKSVTCLQCEECRAEHAHGVHVLRERADHDFHVLRYGGALVEVSSEVIHLRKIVHGARKFDWKSFEAARTKEWAKSITACVR